MISSLLNSIKLQIYKLIIKKIGSQVAETIRYGAIYVACIYPYYSIYNTEISKFAKKTKHNIVQSRTISQCKTYYYSLTM
jgi:hypothetical protein